jgi:hypothetical protein
MSNRVLLAGALLFSFVILTAAGVPAGAADKDEPELKPGGFAGRSGAVREKLLKEEGGNVASEAAVAAGLKWLALHQAVDGHWGLDDFSKAGKCKCGGPGVKEDIGGTALALLPFLGAGQTHKPAKGQIYSKQIERGLSWLAKKQAQDGQMGLGYQHALATIVLCEAYGMTQDANLKKATQRAVDCSVKWQHKAGGGWRYAPGTAGDTSVTAWHIQALKSAQAAGFDIPKEVWTGATKFLDSVGSADGSGYGYTGNQPSPSMTAAGLLCREHLGYGRRNPALVKGAQALGKVPPTAAYKNLYYYYYATQTMHNLGGNAWDGWNVKMRDLMIDKQDKGQDHQKGSWDPAGDAFGGQFGRLGTTSLALLILEVYYRHVPLYARVNAAKPDEK